MVGDVDHGQQDAQGILSLQFLNAVVNIFGVEAVVFQACSGLGSAVCREEQRRRRQQQKFTLGTEHKWSPPSRSQLVYHCIPMA